MSDKSVEPYDVASWPRASIYEFFRSYDHPWFNLCVQVPVEPLIQWAGAKRERSFFLALLYLSQSAVMSIDAFRLRINSSGLWLHSTLDAGSTVMRDNDTFTFAYFNYAKTFEDFQSNGLEVLQRTKESRHDLVPDEDLGVIHYSMLPWLSFTSMSHPRRHDRDDSVPKIVFGKYHGEDGKRALPVSIEVHHALMDGRDAARYFERLEERFAQPEKWLEA
jgi:chloramphenicol O-acetyltransferase type A